MRKSALSHVTVWIVLFSAGVAAGWSMRERRADSDRASGALLGGLGRASQAQLTLVMLEENRAKELQPLLERQLATDVRSAYQALASGTTRLPAAMPGLSDAMRRAGEYLVRRNARDAGQQAIWVSNRLKESR